MCGAVPSIEAALDMPDVRRAAVVMIAQDIEAARRREMVKAIGGVMGPG
jgi:hypothetical protein